MYFILFFYQKGLFIFALNIGLGLTPIITYGETMAQW